MAGSAAAAHLASMIATASKLPLLRFALAVLVPLAAVGCLPDGRFDALVDGLEVRVEAEGRSARACAEELRGLAEHDPVATGIALDLQDVPPGLRLATAPAIAAAAPAPWRERVRAELARRERALEAPRRLVGDARDQGPAALERALLGASLASAARERLCEARDTGTTLAAMLQRRTVGAGVASSGR